MSQESSHLGDECSVTTGKTQHDLSTERFENTAYDEEQCLAAIRGEKIPDQLGNIGTRACVVRGIRLHYTFATSDAVTALCAETTSRIPQFTRARNARLIMSDVIPDVMDTPETQPYCIWYPDLATQDTYRELARVYPAMRYHVGRACAAAGYDKLYAELDLLPDVSTAEEARESENDSSCAIFDSIMAAPAKYAVMDDYKCSVNTTDPRFPAFLNADTLVRSQLGVRHVLQSGNVREFMPEAIWTIEEDLKFDLPKGEKYTWPDENYIWPELDYVTPEEVQLLYKPLPLDLPIMGKIGLINIAAYEGNVDRYSRLRTPFMDEVEFVCVLRGIRHHTMFARWWATEILREKSFIYTEACSPYTKSHIRTAINARRIMNNDIIGFENKEDDLPWLIWRPLRPRPNILLSLAKICPRMKEQIGIACIFCDYQREYDMIKPVPTVHLRRAAEQSTNTHYLLDLQERAEKEGIDIIRGLSGPSDESLSLEPDIEPTSDKLRSRLDELAEFDEQFRCYYGYNAIVNQTERHVWASKELLHKVEILGGGEWQGDVLDLEMEPTPEEADLKLKRTLV